MTVLPEEYAAALRELEDIGTTEHVDGTAAAPNSYAWRLALASGYRVVLGMVDQSNASAMAIAVTRAIDRWAPRYVLLVGIAGGLHREGLKKGDVVISSVIWDYEYGKLEAKFSPRQDFTYLVDPALLRSAEAFAMTPDWSADLPLAPDGTRGACAISGPIASGSKVVEQITDEFFNQVIKVWPKLQAIEMEGAGAAAAIEAARQEGKQVGFIMIRGISDMPAWGSDADAGEPNSQTRAKWKLYASTVAARFASRWIVKQWPTAPRQSELRGGSLESNEPLFDVIEHFITDGTMIYTDPWTGGGSVEEVEFKALLKDKLSEAIVLRSRGSWAELIQLYSPLVDNSLFAIDHPEWADKPLFCAHIQGAKCVLFEAHAQLGTRVTDDQESHLIEAFKLLNEIVRVGHPYSERGAASDRLPESYARTQNLNYASTLEFAEEWLDGWGYHLTFINIRESEVQATLSQLKERLNQLAYVMREKPE
jgi:nucleoside phosphorylase